MLIVTARPRNSFHVSLRMVSAQHARLLSLSSDLCFNAVALIDKLFDLVHSFFYFFLHFIHNVIIFVMFFNIVNGILDVIEDKTSLKNRKTKYVK